MNARHNFLRNRKHCPILKQSTLHFQTSILAGGGWRPKKFFLKMLEIVLYVLRGDTKTLSFAILLPLSNQKANSEHTGYWHINAARSMRADARFCVSRPQTQLHTPHLMDAKKPTVSSFVKGHDFLRETQKTNFAKFA